MKSTAVENSVNNLQRCINIDWLEVFAHEPVQEPRDANFFRAHGFWVHEREYGTRVYAQMFTIEDEHGNPFVEVRRAPLSTSKTNGLFAPNDCHLRLVNRQCYRDDAVTALKDFCERWGYIVSRISRIDIALDFERFDSGDDPQKFLDRYIKGKFSKVNQANVHCHGTDTWSSRDWNSVSWGAPSSMIGTKLYNKSKELEEVKDKPYIVQAWMKCGLIENPLTRTKTNRDGLTYKPQIWRLEFSIKSSVRGWFVIENQGQRKDYRSIKNTFAMYDCREKLLSVFSSLTQHYFHFKYFKNNKIKYECPDKKLFNFGVQDSFYKVEHPATAINRDTDLARLQAKLQNYRLTHTDIEVRRAVDTIIRAIQGEDLRRFVPSPFNRAELIALQQTIALRMEGASGEPSAIMQSIIEAATKGDKLF